MKALWAGRELADVTPALDRCMKLMAENTNAVGGWDKLDPWNLLDCAGMIDHPLAGEIAAKYIPMILRSQSADGGWGDRSEVVFRALVKHGLFDILRPRPPLPRDWRITHSIPAPPGDLMTMTWDGRRLWVLDRKAREAIAVSPADGKVLKRLKLQVPEPVGIGWLEGDLLVSRGHLLDKGGARLYRVDPETGAVGEQVPMAVVWKPLGSVQVGREVWVAQEHWTSVRDLAAGTGRSQSLSGGGPIDLAVEGEAIWHVDWMVPGALFKSDRKGKPLAMADAPFFKAMTGKAEARLGTHGITHDGEDLWVLDGNGKRICIIERAGAGKAPAPRAGGAGE